MSHEWLAEHHKEEPTTHLSMAVQGLKEFNARKKMRGAIFSVSALNRVKYLTKCMEMKIKPNSAVVKLLDSTEEQEEDLTVMDFTNNYLGAKGIHAALASVADSTTIHTLKLAGNQMENDAVGIVVEMLRTHPTITSVDLSNNPITQLAGRQILGLLQENHNIIELNMAETYVQESMIAKINAQLERNQRPNNKVA
eukprot:NODE_2560_length_902_cov_81.922626_g2104_i0.p1 GENE.NODE_2560_length_902_cov_81.922626_g2104_i0~~NODE_2560_length_902_cov_81.922626_g2104_i0.p1  ORF type:complete len:196 (+),score=70.97 NODE_2560_length_902_cov_81.922626_g2104_i0:187-774(+)